MAQWHGYFGIENINLNSNQRDTLVEALRALGPSSDPQPAQLNHWRTRTDNQAVLFEASFDEEVLTIDVFKDRLGSIFDVDPDTILHSVDILYFFDVGTPVVTFSRTGTDYLKVALFGGVGSTWQQSRREVQGYLLANLEDWDPEI